MTYAEGAVLYDPPVHTYAPQGREQTVAIATPVVAPPVAAPPVPHEWEYTYAPAPARPTGIRFGRLLLIGLISGLLVALGLVAIEFFGPRLRGTLPDQVPLERQTFETMEFAIGIPRGWEVRNEKLGSRSAVTVLEPAGAGDSAGLREFQIVAEKQSIVGARVNAATRLPPSGVEIRIVDGISLDGRKAFRHLYIVDDEYREQWWIERGKGTYRLEFSAPASRREEASLLNVRIARTFDVL
jgi:hypothetical protein